MPPTMPSAAIRAVKGKEKGTPRRGRSDPSGKEGTGTGEGKDGQGRSDAKDKAGSGGKEGKDNGGQHQQGKGQNRGSRGNKGRAPRGEQGNNDSSGSSWLAEVANKVGPVLKWIVFGLLALAVLVFLLRGGLRYLAQFSQWARDLLNSLSKWWARLFGRRGGTIADGSDADAAEVGHAGQDFRRVSRSLRRRQRPADEGDAVDSLCFRGLAGVGGGAGSGSETRRNADGVRSPARR